MSKKQQKQTEPKLINILMIHKFTKISCASSENKNKVINEKVSVNDKNWLSGKKIIFSFKKPMFVAHVDVWFFPEEYRKYDFKLFYSSSKNSGKQFVQMIEKKDVDSQKSQRIVIYRDDVTNIKFTGHSSSSPFLHITKIKIYGYKKIKPVGTNFSTQNAIKDNIMMQPKNVKVVQNPQQNPQMYPVVPEFEDVMQPVLGNTPMSMVPIQQQPIQNNLINPIIQGAERNVNAVLKENEYLKLKIKELEQGKIERKKLEPLSLTEIQELKKKKMAELNLLEKIIQEKICRKNIFSHFEVYALIVKNQQLYFVTSG